MQMIIKSVLLAAIVAQTAGADVETPLALNDIAVNDNSTVNPTDVAVADAADVEKTLAGSLTEEEIRLATAVIPLTFSETETLEESEIELLELYRSSLELETVPTENKESIEFIIKGRVSMLFKKVSTSTKEEDITEEERQLFESFSATQAKEDSELKWFELLEKQAMTDLLNMSPPAADEASGLDLLERLDFQNRRDDQKYNLALDLEKEDGETDEDFESRKTNLKLEAVYKPSLWKSYNEVANIKTTGSDLGKSYVNIPYKLNFAKDADSELTINAKNDLIAVMDLLREETCINFTELNDYTSLSSIDQQYVEFVNDQKRGCDEIIGRKDISLEHPQKQPFSEVCQNSLVESENGQSTMGHYLMHILGFDNEHQRTDVKQANMIVTDDLKNSVVGEEVGKDVAPKVPMLQGRGGHNDLKASTDNLSILSGFAYDKSSIMHWSNNFIGDDINTNITHMRRGQEKPFSVTDLDKIKAVYGCSSLSFDLMTDKECHFIITEDGSVDVPTFCLYETEDDKVVGNSHIYVEGKEEKLAKISLTYDIQAGKAAAGSESELPSTDALDADALDAELPSAESEDKRSLVDSEVVVGESVLEGDASGVAVASGIAPAQDLEAPAQKDAEDPAQVPVVPVEGLEAPNDLEAPEVEVKDEKTFEVKAEDFKEEFKAQFSEEGDCVIAKLAYENGGTKDVLCGEQSAMEVLGECGQPLKFSYKLDSSSLTDGEELNEVPSLKVSVTYESCESPEAALVAEDNASTMTLTTLFLALF